MAAPLLEVEDLRVHFETEDGLVKAVDGISYTVDRGETLGIVGESGSGKSVSSLTVMGLTRARNARISGSVRFDGRDLLGASDDDLRQVRGNEIAMIFQDPLSSLHPFYKVGAQIVEAIQTHRDVSKSQARDRAVEMLGLDIGILLGGAILTETVFNVQGIGRFAYEAIVRFDLPVIQGTVLFGAFFIIIANLVVDVLYGFLDPRVRFR